jgi:hypothetical protein
MGLAEIGDAVGGRSAGSVRAAADDCGHVAVRQSCEVVVHDRVPLSFG